MNDDRQTAKLMIGHGCDLEAIDLASAYWRRGDHAEALHHLEKGLGDMFPGLGDLPETFFRGERRWKRINLEAPSSAEGHQNQQEAWSGESATGR